MGMGLSAPRDKKTSSHELLGINEFTTLEETKKEYYKLFYKFRSDENTMALLNKAHDECRRSLNADLYLELYSKIYNCHEIKKGAECKCKNRCICEQLARLKLKNSNSNSTINLKEPKSSMVDDSKFKLNSLDIIRDSNEIIIKYKQNSIVFRYNSVSSDFFERLKACFDIKIAPKFFDSDFVGFYNFWKKFSHVDKELETKVRRIIKIIERQDPRINMDGVSSNNIEKKDVARKDVVKKEKSREKSCTAKEKKFYCELCKKGFNNSNTVRDHLNSKQHTNKVQESGGGTYIKTDVDLFSNDAPKDTTKSTFAESKADSAADSDQSQYEIQEKQPSVDIKSAEHIKSEHTLLRTCSICKIVLKTRGELIMHLKSSHP